MHLFFKSAFAGIFFLLFSGQNNAQTQNWQLVSDQGDIQVYTRQLDGSSLKEVKMKTVFKAKAETLLETLQAVDQYPQWVYKCTESATVQTNAKNDFVYYTRTSLPTPISDRDLVAHCKQWTDEATRISYSISKAISGFTAKKSGVVRILEFETNWAIKPLGNNQIEIENIITTNPSGSIPTWVINMEVTKGPMHSMKSLKAIVEAKELIAQRVGK